MKKIVLMALVLTVALPHILCAMKGEGKEKKTESLVKKSTAKKIEISAKKNA